MLVAALATSPNEVVASTSRRATTEVLRESAGRRRSTPPTSRCRARSSSRPRAADGVRALLPAREPRVRRRRTGERPPLIVMSHGGPTGNATPIFDLEMQFWTTRGFAVVDVNYGGSTGYGRAYRERLNGQWGVVDLQDCVNAARYLVERGRGRRRAAPHHRRERRRVHDDLRAHVHRRLRGRRVLRHRRPRAVRRGRHAQVRAPLRAHARRPVSGARRPLPRAQPDPLRRPDLDADARPPGGRRRGRPAGAGGADRGGSRERGVPHAYLLFEGEGHGFRKAENIVRSLEAELSFYLRSSGSSPAIPCRSSRSSTSRRDPQAAPRPACTRPRVPFPRHGVLRDRGRATAERHRARRREQERCAPDPRRVHPRVRRGPAPRTSRGSATSRRWSSSSPTSARTSTGPGRTRCASIPAGSRRPISTRCSRARSARRSCSRGRCSRASGGSPSRRPAAT